KQFISGAFMAIVMTGLDQDMMQKNLSCRSLRDAQKNMISFSLVLLIVNVFFLALGAMLFIFAERSGIQVPEKTDLLYPLIAVGGYLGPVAGVVFILGLIAAAYSSADSALTALTTSFCVDIIDIESKPVQSRIRIRKRVHILISAILLLLILTFKSINDKSVIESLFTVAGYTYGPLLGLFAFGLFTRIRPHDRYVLAVCILAPVAGFIFQKYAPEWFNGYEVGFELLLINGLLTFAGLLCIGKYRGSLVRE
ncbi:MAG: sodium:solute symporter, partial [Flavobacteriales bacterium]